WTDLLVGGEAGGLHLFKNRQGHGFPDVSSIPGPPVNAADAALADVNHDSRPDLLTLTKGMHAERLQLANGTFAPRRDGGAGLVRAPAREVWPSPMLASNSAVAPAGCVVTSVHRSRSRYKVSLSPSGKAASRWAPPCSSGRSRTASTRRERMPGARSPAAARHDAPALPPR